MILLQNSLFTLYSFQEAAIVTLSHGRHCSKWLTRSSQRVGRVLLSPSLKEMMKLRHREVKQIARGYTVSNSTGIWIQVVCLRIPIPNPCAKLPSLISGPLSTCCALAIVLASVLPDLLDHKLSTPFPRACYHVLVWLSPRGSFWGLPQAPRCSFNTGGPWCLNLVRS